MVKLTNAIIENGNTDFNLTQKDKTEIIQSMSSDIVMKKLIGFGVLNTQGVIAGDTFKAYNLDDVDSQGTAEWDNQYELAETHSMGFREVRIGVTRRPFKLPKKEALTHNRELTSTGDVKEKVKSQAAPWIGKTVRWSVINQLAGNNAASILARGVSSTAFTSDARLRVTGHNTVDAINSTYNYFANNPNGAVTNASQITDANVPSLVDFMGIDILLERSKHDVLIPSWGYDDEMKTVVIGQSIWQQMLVKEPTAGKYPNIAFETYQRLAGSNDKMREEGEGSPNCRIYHSVFTPNMRFMVVPDDILPQSVHNNAAQANTRVTLILGAKAIDYRFAELGGAETPFMLMEDTTTMKNNLMDFYSCIVKFGCKRIALLGKGANSNTRYEKAVAVLNSYSVF